MSGCLSRGPVAQLGARLNGIQKVRGSNPLGSTTYSKSASPTEQRSNQSADPAGVLGALYARRVAKSDVEVASAGLEEAFVQIAGRS